MILIVDDKPENIFSLKTILELHSFPTDTALSGEEALKKILRNSYALIILDVQMPGMDGFEVAEAISGYSKARDIPIIFLSAASTDKKFITKGYSSGAMDYITKPIDPDILLLKVKTFYRLYEQNRELVRIQASLRSEIEFRKKVEGELQERAGELHSILESIPQIAFTTRADGRIEFVNEQVAEIRAFEG
ncbi:response regulator [Puia sp. P3]|uniref:response regulator n=1 Tax=Puia sp. P3 TaxID=3423952 RepID=UPI003D67A1D6